MSANKYRLIGILVLVLCLVAIRNLGAYSGSLFLQGIAQGKVRAKQAQTAKKKPDHPVFEASCRGHLHGPGCVAAKYVRSGQIRIPGSDDIHDFKIAIGSEPKPATRYTGDAGTVHYYTVNKTVWKSLVRMANSLDSSVCHTKKGKNHKKHKVCKTIQGEVTISCLITCHDYYASSGKVSNHSVGEAVDVGALRWRGKWYTINASFQYSRLGKWLMQKMTIACMRGGAEEAISLYDFGYGDRSFAMSNHDDHLHCGGY